MIRFQLDFTDPLSRPKFQTITTFFCSHTIPEAQTRWMKKMKCMGAIRQQIPDLGDLEQTSALHHTSVIFPWKGVLTAVVVQTLHAELKLYSLTITTDDGSLQG